MPIATAQNTPYNIWNVLVQNWNFCQSILNLSDVALPFTYWGFDQNYSCFFYILQYMAKELPVLVVKVAINLPFEVIEFT